MVGTGVAQSLRLVRARVARSGRQPTARCRATTETRCSTDGGAAPREGPATRRRPDPAHRHHRRPPHHDRPGHGRRRPAVAIANGWLRAGLLLLVLTARPRRARRRRGQGLGHRLAPRRLLRLGRRPGHRRAAARRRGLVPRRPPSRAASSVLPLAVLGASMLISYERAKAESLGFDARGGLMERAERLVVPRLRPAVRLAARPRPVGDAGPHPAHRRPAVRQGVAPGVGARRSSRWPPAGGPAGWPARRSAPGGARPLAQPPPALSAGDPSPPARPRRCRWTCVDPRRTARASAVAQGLPGGGRRRGSRRAWPRLAALRPQRRAGAMVERNLRRVDPRPARARRCARRVAGRLPVLRPLLRRVVPAARRSAPPSSTPASPSTATSTSTRPSTRAAAPILGLPHLGRLGVGGVLADAGPRAPGHRGRRALEPPELFEWFVELPRAHRHERRAARPRRRPGGGRPRSRPTHVVVPAVRPRHRRRRRRGRVLRRAHHAARGPGHAGAAHRARRCCRPPSTPRAADHHGVVRPPLPAERRGTFRDDVARVTQDLADELEELIRRAPEQWHLMQPNWPSDRAGSAPVRL